MILTDEDKKELDRLYDKLGCALERYNNLMRISPDDYEDMRNKIDDIRQEIIDLTYDPTEA